MQKLNAMDWIAMILVVVGGLNWGLWGAFEFDLVATLFGNLSALSKIVYILVALSAVYLLFSASRYTRKQSA
ncbi:MAG: DUF378 domain-containing protein [bacterium]